MPRRGFRSAALAVIVVLPLVLTPPSSAQSHERVFTEPAETNDFLLFSEFPDQARQLRERYPDYVEVTRIDAELRDKNAVSVGRDGVPAWDREDTGDGLPFRVLTVTDRSVPDAGKGYVLFTVAHAAEFCGREGIPRFLEDLLIWAEDDPDRVIEGGTGITGHDREITVAELLATTKLYFVDVAPDGWEAGEDGEKGRRSFRTTNGAGMNNNRIAYQDGWVFPDDPVIRKNGYSVLTQPEGAAVTQYLRGVRDEELGGAPFAAAMDFHGPLPLGALLIHDQGNDPAKLDRIHDFAERVRDRSYDVLDHYITENGSAVHMAAASLAGAVRDEGLKAYEKHVGPVSQKAAYITAHWSEYATLWEHIDYTVAASFNGWAGSRTGLGADAMSYEIPCEVQTGLWKPTEMQLYIDNVRAVAEAVAVHAAFRTRDEVAVRHEIGGRIGFYEHGRRVTDTDGNPSPPPEGFPGHPMLPQIEQQPYDVANTDYFRSLRRIVDAKIVQVRPRDAKKLRRLDTLVVADTAKPKPKALRAFAYNGGTLVLTDRALKLLPDLLGVPSTAVTREVGYVGYADLDTDHPRATGLYERAGQTYDPIGLGYELLMERDQYWPCDDTGATCEESITRNRAPIWTVDRRAWEDVGGTTVGTADPPGPKGLAEGQDTDHTVIGELPFGKGRIVVFGALLPQPTEKYPHWFGLNGYTVSITGQQLLLNALKES